MAQIAYKTQPAAANPRLTVVIPAEEWEKERLRRLGEDPQEEVPALRVVEPKYKKDGTAKKTVSNKKAGEKSEVYPFATVDDIKGVMSWFLKNEMWIQYLIFVLSCNLARRISDTLNLKWSDIFDPRTGKFRSNMEIKEKKTDKLANPRINSACRDAVNLYLEKTGCDPSANNYGSPVFLQLSGTHKGKVISSNGYLKPLKRAAEATGIEYNVGTHSTRKTFGKMNRMLHPGDYDSMELLQTIYNHSDTKTTKRYIGLTKEKVDKYFDDMGDFWNDYVVGDKTFEDVSEQPVVSLDTNDLREVIARAYRAGGENAGNPDGTVHIEAINSIMSMIDSLAK